MNFDNRNGRDCVIIMDLTIVVKLLGEYRRIVHVNQFDIIGPTILSIYNFPNSFSLLIGCKGKEILPYLTFQEQTIQNGDVLIISIKKKVYKERNEQILKELLGSIPFPRPPKHSDIIKTRARIYDITFLSLECSPQMIPIFKSIFFIFFIYIFI